MDGLWGFVSSLGPLTFAFGPLILLAAASSLLEIKFPRRKLGQDGLRWLTNAALTLLGVLLVQLVAPATAFLSAVIAEHQGVGLLRLVDIGWPAQFVIGFLAYDLMYYLIHRVMHEVPFLWRLHRTHHVDGVVDASTSILHHPLETVVTAMVVAVVVPVSGISANTIFFHYLAMQIFAFWQHANVRAFPGQRFLAPVLIVPELHHVHHSTSPNHYNTNYGAVFSFWDRLFGTLVDDPALDGNMTFGLDKSYWDHPATFASLLIDPVRGAGTSSGEGRSAAHTEQRSRITSPPEGGGAVR